MENEKRLIDANELQKRLLELGAEPDYQHQGEDWGVGVCVWQRALWMNCPPWMPWKWFGVRIAKALVSMNVRAMGIAHTITDLQTRSRTISVPTEKG